MRVFLSLCFLYLMLVANTPAFAWDCECDGELPAAEGWACSWVNPEDPAIGCRIQDIGDCDGTCTYQSVRSSSQITRDCQEDESGNCGCPDIGPDYRVVSDNCFRSRSIYCKGSCVYRCKHHADRELDCTDKFPCCFHP